MTKAPIADRRIHARGSDVEIVRYERAGKWYVEPASGRRRALSLAEAVATALELEGAGGAIFLGVPGGGTFDAQVRRLRGRA